MMERQLKVIISGGGTGGHIFPAISIANALKSIDSNIDILFVGAEGKMEMEKIPAAGYRIIGLPVAGIKRKLSLSNLAVPLKLLRSLKIARTILKDFKPDVVVGVGGYASAPLLKSAVRLKIPSLIQEQNSYAGLTNRLLSKKADIICVAYENMEKFFPQQKIIFTGNPIRKEIDVPTESQKEEGYKFFQLDPEKPTLLIVGGSLGSLTLNNTVKKWIESGGDNSSFQVIWQSGSYYKSDIGNFLSDKELKSIHNYEFISRMDLAYAVSDVIISRAGAGTISELCAAGKATIFVPSPNVAEDHQTHNAMALVNKKAALMVSDEEAGEALMADAERLLNNRDLISELESNIYKLAKKDASQRIAEEVIKLANKEVK